MAQHIDNVADSPIQKVTKAQFYALCRPGDIVACSGQGKISRAIEGQTDSPFSHVLQMFSLPWVPFWLQQESIFGRGCRVGVLSDYVDGYDGDLVLCRRPALTIEQIETELTVGFELLDDTYDWTEEVSMAARKLIRLLPPIRPEKQLYCSGYLQAKALQTIPYRVPPGDPDWLTPEQIFTDPSVTAVCALLKGSR